MTDSSQHQDRASNTLISAVAKRESGEMPQHQINKNYQFELSSEPFGDLPAVRAMVSDKPSAHDNNDNRDQLEAHNTRNLSTHVLSYRSRSPLRVRAGNGSVRGRSRSPVHVPEPRLEDQQQKARKDVQTDEPRRQAKYPPGQTNYPPGQAQEVSAIMRYCMKCFHSNGISNGKGHPFVCCPHASKAARELATAIEARQAGAAIHRDGNGNACLYVCLSDHHRNKTEALRCFELRSAGGNPCKGHAASVPRSLSAEVVPFLTGDCLCCMKSKMHEDARTHTTLDCPRADGLAKRWTRARAELDSIYKRCGLPSSKMQLEQQALQSVSSEIQQSYTQEPQQLPLRTPVSETQLNKECKPHIHPSRLALCEDHVKAEPSPEPEPERNPEPRPIVEDCEPDKSWEAVVLNDMLQMEMATRPNNWLAVAVAVQGYLRHQLMVDITQGDPREGVPFSIPLLEILDKRIADLRQVAPFAKGGGLLC